MSASGSGVPGGWGPKAVFSFFQQETDSQVRDIPVTGMVFSFRAGKGLATSSELSGGLLWESWCPYTLHSLMMVSAYLLLVRLWDELLRQTPDRMGKALDPCGMGRTPLGTIVRLLLAMVGVNAVLSVASYF